MMNNKNSIINITVDGMGKGIEEALIEKYIADNYIMAVEGVAIKQEKIDSFVEACKKDSEIGVKQESDFEKTTFGFSEVNVNILIGNSNSDYKWHIRLNKPNGELFYGTLFASDFRTCETLFNIFKEFEHSLNEVVVAITTISLHPNGNLSATDTKIREIGDFSGVSKLYYPFLNTDEMFKQYFISKDKLLLLAGEPGTGKTKIVDLMMQYCIKKPEMLGYTQEEIDEGVDISIGYVKNIDVLHLDNFWGHLSAVEYDIVILDDVDHMLIDRKNPINTGDDVNRKKFISHFLSFTDGIFDKKTKFVITTNQEVSSIDRAILRKGRCFDILKFRRLTNKEGMHIWKESNLKEEIYQEEFADNESILSCDLGSKVNFFKNLDNNKIEHVPYLLESGISIMNNISNKKISIGDKR